MKRRILAIPLVLLLAISLVATGCAPAAEKVAYEDYVSSLPEGCEPVPPECFEQAMQEGKLSIYEWAEYFPDEIYEDFSEEFGIEVTRDFLASTDEAKAKFSLYPETPYDLLPGIGSSAFFVLKEVGALQQINHDWIPNVWEYAPEELVRTGPYDPGWEYSIDILGYSMAYIYNTKYVDDPRIPSLAVIFDPMDEYKGRIVLADEMVDVIGMALKYLGYSFYSVDEAELTEARDLLMELKPHILAFDSWPWTLVLGDEAWIVHCWSEDSWYYVDAYEAIARVLPTEGSYFEIFPSLHPIGSPNPAAAHLFLNYFWRPEVMARLIESLSTHPIHTAVPELLSEEALLRGIIPEEHIAKASPFDIRAFTGRGLELRVEIWEELRM